MEITQIIGYKAYVWGVCRAENVLLGLLEQGIVGKLLDQWSQILEHEGLV